MLSARLTELLREANLDVDALGPGDAWARLHHVHGRRITLVDRYELEEHAAGSPIAADDRDRIIAEVLAAHYPGIELIGSSGGDPVDVVPSDDSWPDRFHMWRDRILSVLDARWVEHVGSTAVPGLPAKPVIDVLVGVADVEDETAYRSQLESLGVPLRMREPGHRYFRPPAGQARVVQIHVCDADGDWGRAHLLFRDFLRSHGDERDAYAALKLSLAERFWDDRNAYTDGKTDFILDALDRAEVWARQTGWTR